MRQLSQFEADRCEHALEPVCKCRCGGAKHGAARIARGGDYSALPTDDPHYRPLLTRAQARRALLRAERGIMAYNFRFVEDRETYITEHGFDAWLEVTCRELKACAEAKQILIAAARAV